jgi:hypothetical protein
MRLTALIVATFGLAASAANARQCENSGATTVRDVNLILHERAAEILARAKSDGWSSDPQLVSLIAPDAEFNLGSGDVSSRIVAGPASMHRFAVIADADGYRYRPWSGPNYPANLCGEHKLKIEFYNSVSHLSSDIEFVFIDGRLTAASGWQQFIEPMSMPEVTPN